MVSWEKMSCRGRLLDKLTEALKLMYARKLNSGTLTAPHWKKLLPSACFHASCKVRWLLILLSILLPHRHPKHGGWGWEKIFLAFVCYILKHFDSWHIVYLQFTSNDSYCFKFLSRYLKQFKNVLYLLLIICNNQPQKKGFAHFSSWITTRR